MGHRRIQGEMARLGHPTASSAVWNILHARRDRPGTKASRTELDAVPDHPGRGYRRSGLLPSRHRAGPTPLHHGLPGTRHTPTPPHPRHHAPHRTVGSPPSPRIHDELAERGRARFLLRDLDTTSTGEQPNPDHPHDQANEPNAGIHGGQAAGGRGRRRCVNNYPSQPCPSALSSCATVSSRQFDPRGEPAGGGESDRAVAGRVGQHVLGRPPSPASPRCPGLRGDGDGSGGGGRSFPDPRGRRRRAAAGAGSRHRGARQPAVRG